MTPRSTFHTIHSVNDVSTIAKMPINKEVPAVSLYMKKTELITL